MDSKVILDYFDRTVGSNDSAEVTDLVNLFSLHKLHDVLPLIFSVYNILWTRKDTPEYF